ncbi:MAG: CPBP family intramembrane metalloprotease [Lachnospiraceae bacterium]|nr:CPBP family intramembrane metalloprotease [Lachnospiraceae bacterium]
MNLTWQQKIWKYGGAFLHAIKPVLIYMIVPPFLLAVLSPLLNRGNYEVSAEYYMYASNFYTFLGLVFVILIFWKSAKKRQSYIMEEVTLSLQDLNKTYLFGMILFGAAAAVSISSIYTLLPKALMQSYEELSYGSFKAYDVTLAIISAVVLAPVLEEIVFRGYMLGRLLPVFGEKKAVAVVSILFALCHINLFWGLYGLVMGYLLAKVSIRQDNLLYSIAMHIGFNLPSAVNYVILNNERLYHSLYGNKFLIVCYGMTAGCIVLLLWRQYKKYENI